LVLVFKICICDVWLNWKRDWCSDLVCYVTHWLLIPQERSKKPGDRSNLYFFFNLLDEYLYTIACPPLLPTTTLVGLRKGKLPLWLNKVMSGWSVYHIMFIMLFWFGWSCLSVIVVWRDVLNKKRFITTLESLQTTSEVTIGCLLFCFQSWFVNCSCFCLYPWQFTCYCLMHASNLSRGCYVLTISQTFASCLTLFHFKTGYVPY
jgi:hypothetical protein